MGAVPSTLHQIIKFPTPWGIRAIKGDQESKPRAPHSEEPEIEDMDDVPLIEGNWIRNLKIGSKFSEGLRRRLIDFLRLNSDCFAWSHLDMPGIDPEIIMHQLQVDPLHQLIRQKQRKFAPERDTIINKEVCSRMAGQRGRSQKKKWKMASLH